MIPSPNTYVCPLCSTQGDQWEPLNTFTGVAPVATYRCECDARHHLHADGALETFSARKMRRVAAAIADATDPFKGSEGR